MRDQNVPGGAALAASVDICRMVSQWLLGQMGSPHSEAKSRQVCLPGREPQGSPQHLCHVCRSKSLASHCRGLEAEQDGPLAASRGALMFLRFFLPATAFCQDGQSGGQFREMDYWQEVKFRTRRKIHLEGQGGQLRVRILNKLQEWAGGGVGTLSKVGSGTLR